MKNALAILAAAVLLALPALAAEPPKPPIPMPPRTPYDSVTSPQVAPDGRITFRIYAPQAHAVAVKPWFRADALALSKDKDGVWSVTTDPVAPGAYRYQFLVDDAIVADPRNTYNSPMHVNNFSLVEVPGDASDLQTYHAGIPRGAIVEQTYDSPVAGPARRLHLYLPPGYRNGRNYPVLYLLHGGGDSDFDWPTEGRAGVILDNLIAQGKAKPMVVVFPDGIVEGSDFFSGKVEDDKFGPELTTVIVPLIEATYNVSRRPEDRALAGLSMGGIQTLNIGLPHTKDFRYLGVFSSGWFPNGLQIFEQDYGAILPEARKNLKVFWWGYGDTDIARQNSLNALAMLEKHGAKPDVIIETPGGHTMVNWRLYLCRFAPLLFR
jgi:enterochelin esterase-like enzyme